MAYTAKAVHFGGSTYLSTTSLTSTDGGKLSLSFWFKGIVTNVSPNGPYPFFVVDPSGADQPKSYFSPGPTVAPIWWQLTIDSSKPPTTNTHGMVVDTNWHHILYSFDSTIAAHPSQLYLDGNMDSAVVDAAINQVMNGKSFYFGNDTLGNFLVGDIADVWIAPGVSLIDPVSLTILPATQLLFTDATGRPQNPSGFPAGGVVIFSGDHTTFPTNQGSGGSFTLTGSLSDATTNPSTGTIGFTNPVRVTHQGTTIQMGWSDPQSNFAYIIGLDFTDPNFTSMKIDKTQNLIVQQATITDGAPPIITRMTLGGMVGPWSDATRMFGVGVDASNNWYVTSISRSTLLPTHTVSVLTNTNPPINSFSSWPASLSCSSDGKYVVFCANSTSPPVANQSHVAVYNSSNDAFTRTTATSLGITTDSFTSLTMDASNNIYCGGDNGNVYKLSFNTSTLAASLTSTFTLASGFPTPNGSWAVYALTYLQPTGNIVVWYLDTGGTPVQARFLVINTSGTIVSGPFLLPTGINPGNNFIYNSFGESDMPPIGHWTNKTKFTNATLAGALPYFEVTDVTTGTTTETNTNIWLNTAGGDHISLGLTVYDPGTNTFWMQTEDISNMTGLNPIAQFLLPAAASSNARSFSKIFGNFT